MEAFQGPPGLFQGGTLWDLVRGALSPLVCRFGPAATDISGLLISVQFSLPLAAVWESGQHKLERPLNLLSCSLFLPRFQRAPEGAQ